LPRDHRYGATARPSERGANLFPGPKIPLGRIGQPEDLVGTAVFLASDAADFITGQTVIVNGGSIMW
jgi:NAD(P)-dependent dehydrogenase (short-subunit alcohol dehydrogenase family)